MKETSNISRLFIGFLLINPLSGVAKSYGRAGAMTQESKIPAFKHKDLSPDPQSSHVKSQAWTHMSTIAARVELRLEETSRSPELTSQLA